MAYKRKLPFKMGVKKNVNIQRVVSKIVASIIVLYVGGQLLSAVGGVIENTSSPFYQGLEIIGWTVTSTVNATASSCAQHGGDGIAYGNCVTSTSTGTGILTVVGIIAIASVIMEFVYFKL